MKIIVVCGHCNHVQPINKEKGCIESPTHANDCCGVSRPKEKSLAERLRDIYISGDDRYLPWNEVGSYDKCKWQAVAQEAERYFNE